MTGVVTLPEGVEMVMPGDSVSISAELITPIAMDAGLRFAIREGGRTVGRRCYQRNYSVKVNDDTYRKNTHSAEGLRS